MYDAVDKPKVPKKAMQVFTIEEASRFLAAAKSDRFHALHVVAVASALRQGGLLEFTLEDPDLKGQTLSGQW